MNYGVLNRIAAATLMSLALASCGGSSDDEAGSPTAFQTVPTGITFQGDGVNCLGGSQQIFVYGGVAPYQLDNTNTSAITLDKSSIGSRGGNFTVTVANGACMTDIPVVVKDALDHVTTVTVSSKPTKPS